MVKILLGSTWIEVERLDSDRLLVNGKEYAVDSHQIEPGLLSLIIDGKPVTISVTKDSSTLSVSIKNHVFKAQLEDPASSDEKSLLEASGKEMIYSKMPGKILALHVEEGQQVAAGQGLLVLEAMKMENEILAPFAGVVREVKIRGGEVIGAGHHLLTLEAENSAA